MTQTNEMLHCQIGPLCIVNQHIIETVTVVRAPKNGDYGKAGIDQPHQIFVINKGGRSEYPINAPCLYVINLFGFQFYIIVGGDDA